MTSFPADSFESPDPQYLSFSQFAKTQQDEPAGNPAPRAEFQPNEAYAATVPFRSHQSDAESILLSAGPRLRRTRAAICREAEATSPLVIHGDAGTETESAAQLVHRCATKAIGGILKFNCSVLTAELFDELAMPAIRRQARNVSGIIGTRGEAIRTVVLLHADAISQRQQREIAQALRQAFALHASEDPSADTPPRLIATTSQDIRSEEGQNCFEKSFLNLFETHSIRLPSLCETKEDIPELVQEILEEFAQEEGFPRKIITTGLLDVLRTYNWPGNVQELKNVLARACSLGGPVELLAEDVVPWFASDELAECENNSLTFRQMERKLIETTFARYAGNREKTANALQIGLRTLSGKLREYGYPPRGGPGSNLVRPAAKAA